MTITGGTGPGSGAAIFSGIFTNSGEIFVIGSDANRQTGQLTFAECTICPVRGQHTNSGTITVTGASTSNSGSISGSDGASFLNTNTGKIEVTGGAGEFSGCFCGIAGDTTNSGTITVIGGSGKDSGRYIVGNGEVHKNFGTITAIVGTGPNSGVIFNQNILLNEETGTITGIVIGNPVQFLVVSTGSEGGISRHTPPSFGQNSDLSHWLLRDAFCVDIKNCWDIPGNHGVPFDLLKMGASVHTFSIKVYCPRGPQDCTHVGLSVEPYGTDINSAIWTVAMHKDFGTTGDMRLIVNDPPTDEYTEGYLGEVTGTSQIIKGEGNAYQFVSFTMDMLVPTPGGMMFGLHAWDSSGGTTNSYQNDGIEIVDTFVYPTMDSKFEEPLDIPKVCLYEDPDYRHSCAFALKKQLEMEKAEKIREEIMLHNTWYQYLD